MKRKLYSNRTLKLCSWSILAILAIFPLGQLTAIPLGIKYVRIYAHDILIVVTVALWLYQHVKYRLAIRLDSIVLASLIFGLIGFISLIINLSHWGTENTLFGGMYLVRWLAYFSLYPITRDLLFRQVLNRNMLLKMMVLAGFISVLIGLGQYLWLPDFRYASFFGWDPHYFRSIGSFMDSGYTGIIFLLTLILISDFYWLNLLRHCLKSWLVIVLTYVGILLTYARSSYVSFLVSAVLMAIFKKRASIFILSMLTLVAALYLLPRRNSVGTRLERSETIISRVGNWKNGLEVANINLIFGVGFNNYRWAQRELGIIDEKTMTSNSASGTDFSLIFILATTGLTGLFAYLYLILEIFKKNNPVLSISTIVLLAGSLFNNCLFYPWIVIWWWFLSGLAGESRDGK